MNKNWQPRVANTSTSLELFKEAPSGSATPQAGKNEMDISFEDAKHLAGIIRALHAKHGSRTTAHTTTDMGTTGWWTELVPNPPTNEKLNRLVSRFNATDTAVSESCVKLIVHPFSKTPPRKNALTTFSIEPLPVLTFSVQPSYLDKLLPNGRIQQAQEIYWRFAATGDSDTLNIENEAPPEEGYQHIIDVINRPYYLFESVCLAAGLKKPFTDDIRAKLKAGDSHINSISFDCWSKVYSEEQLSSYMVDMLSRMRNIFLYKDAKSSDSRHTSVCYVKRITAEEVMKKNRNFIGVRFHKRTRENIKGGVHRCSIRIDLERSDRMNKTSNPLTVDSIGHRLRFRYRISKYFLLDNRATYFKHLPRNETKVFNQFDRAVSVKDFARMAVGNPSEKKGIEDFNRSVMSIINTINEQEFILPQIMGLRTLTIAEAFEGFISEIKKDDPAAVKKRQEFLDAYKAGRLHVRRGSNKWMPLTNDMIASETGLSDKVIRKYKQSLAAKGIDVDVPYELLVKVSEFVMNSGLTLEQSMDNLQAGNPEKAKALIERMEKALKNPNSRASKELLKQIKEEIDYKSTDNTLLGITMEDKDKTFH